MPKNYREIDQSEDFPKERQTGNRKVWERPSLHCLATKEAQQGPNSGNDGQGGGGNSPSNPAIHGS